jgi:hypothetical protein
LYSAANTRTWKICCLTTIKTKRDLVEMNRIERQDVIRYGAPLLFVAAAVLAGSKRMVKYFPGASHKGLLCSAALGSVGVVANGLKNSEDGADFDRRIYTIAGLAIAAIAAPTLAKTLLGRADLNFRASMRFAFIQGLIFGIVDYLSLYMNPHEQPPEIPEQPPEPLPERPVDPIEIPEPLPERPVDPIEIPEPLPERPDEQIVETVKRSPVFRGIVGHNIFSNFGVEDIGSISLVSTEWIYLSRDNKELVLTALNSGSRWYFLCSNRLKDDREVVLKAIDKINGSTPIRVASKRLRNDYDVVASG